MGIDLKSVASIVFFGESPGYLPETPSEKIKLFVKTNPLAMFIFTGGIALLVLYGLEVGKIDKPFSTVSRFIVNHQQLAIGIGIALLILKMAYARGYWVGQKDTDSDCEFDNDGGIREWVLLVAFGKAAEGLPEKTSEKIQTFVIANLHILFVLAGGVTLLAMYGCEVGKMSRLFSSVSEFIANHKELAIVTGITIALFRIVYAMGYWLGQKDMDQQIYIRSPLLKALGIEEHKNAT